MPESYIHIYINPEARYGWKKKADALQSMLGNDAVSLDLEFPMKPIPDYVTKSIVIGGDGSDRSVTTGMMNREVEDKGIVIVTPAGTENAFYQSLVYEGATIRPEQIAKAEAKKSVSRFKCSGLRTPQSGCI